ncbi:MAG TPA: G1 family glutamic endopeptidase [Solirubrobacteraceae bacterium]|jgi:hypothetical protein|nr:G1 family glutamic endopeptidase [Solirubrobacteraceae bacterium]
MQIPVVGRLAAGLCAVSACAALAAAPAASGHGLLHGPKHKLTASTSTNWSGYTVDGTNATSVTGNWTVRPATCAPKETSWSSPWVGIDGDNSSTVEQTGTDTDCTSGTPSYYAWWEMYPAPTQVISKTISPGDSMTGTVTYGTSGFTMTLTDHTANWSYSTTQSTTKAPRTSVEWIVEGPSNGTLTNFGTLNFSTDSATINGASRSLSAFGSSANSITMTTKKGVTRAAPGTVSAQGAFADTWFHG